MGPDEYVSVTQARWSNIVVFFSSFLVAMGTMIYVSTSAEEAHHRAQCYSHLLLMVGLLGVFTGMLRNKCLAYCLMVLLTLASAATTRIVYDKLLEKKGLCPHFASEVNAARVSHYVEAMPGVFFRIGTELHVEVHVNPEMLHECHKKVMELWYYSVFLLMTLLVCSLTCTWRFILAVKKGEAQDVVDVAYTEVACDGRVTHSVCRVDEFAMVPSTLDDGVVELLDCKQNEGKSV